MAENFNKMSESLDEIHVAKQETVHQFSPEIEEKAKTLSYFHVDPPSNVIDGIAGGEYNIIKGAIAGPAMLVTAPFIGASEEISKHTTLWGKTKGATYGFSNGLVRGVVGCTSLVATGAVTGANQLRIGLTQTRPEPGQGRGWKENWEHVVNTPYTDLITNKESESFRSDLDNLIASGALPEKKFDVDGNEVPYEYQFFITSEPKDFIEGFSGLQYNAGKGFIAGAALAVSAPFLDAYEKYHETDDKGNAGGIEGAVSGFGSGLFRGFVGGCLLAGAGAVHGATQVTKGFASLNNITKGAQVANKVTEDYDRLTEAPILGMVYQKGSGLESFLVKEEERKAREVEEKARAEEEKKEWYKQNPDGVHPTDVPEEAVPLGLDTVVNWNLFSLPQFTAQAVTSEPVTAAGGGVVLVGKTEFESKAAPVEEHDPQAVLASE